MIVGFDLDWTIVEFKKFYNKLLRPSRELTIPEIKALVGMRTQLFRDIVLGVWTKYYGWNGIYPELTDPTWPAVFRSLKRSGVAEKLYIVSARSEEDRANIEDFMKKHGLYGLFDDLILVGETGRKESEDIDVLVDDLMDNCVDFVRAGKRAILWIKDLSDKDLKFPYLKTAKSALEVLSLLTFYGGGGPREAGGFTEV